MSGVLTEVAVACVDGEMLTIRPGTLVQGRNAGGGWLEVESIRTGAGGGFSGTGPCWSLHCRIPNGSKHYVEIVPQWDLTMVGVQGDPAPHQLALWGDA